jgi:hypothetical protein
MSLWPIAVCGLAFFCLSGAENVAFAGRICYINSLGQHVCAEAQEYNAFARCGKTGVVGTAYGYPSPRGALGAAVQDCVQKGGIPECCRRGANLIDRN